MRFRIEHKWLRFSLRSALIAMTLACVWLGWQARVVHERKTLREWLAERDAACNIDQHHHRPAAGTKTPRQWGDISRIRRAMGDEGVFHIELQINIPRDGNRRVTRAFPEAIVHQLGGGDAVEFQLDDQQYAEVKRRRAARAQQMDKLYRLFISTRNEPLVDDPAAFAPWLADDLVESAPAVFEWHGNSAEFTVASLRLASELRTLLTLGKVSTDSQSPYAELARNLRLLQLILSEGRPRAGTVYSTQDFDKCLIEYEIARCDADASRLDRIAGKEKEALARALAAAERLRVAADQAWGRNAIWLTDLTGALRRVWQAKTSQAGLANDALAARAALLEYGEALRRHRAQVETLYEQGSRGGEAEKFCHVSYCAAEQAAMLAEADGDRDATIAAWRLASEQAELALQATQVAFDSNSVMVDALVQAISLQAEARRRLAKLQGDDLAARFAKDEQLRQLQKLARKCIASHFYASP